MKRSNLQGGGEAAKSLFHGSRALCDPGVGVQLTSQTTLFNEMM
jgi:hypothetical protein